MATTYLTKAANNGANQRLFTFSAWVKATSSAFNGVVLAFRESSARYCRIFFEGGKLCLKQAYDGSTEADTKTSALYRDASGWYNIVIAVDTAQATASNRIKMYVNGEQITSFSSSDHGAQNADLVTRTTCYIGQSGDGDNYFDGLMSHVHYIDGTAYAASTFGSTDSTTGEWKINTSPTLTMGTTGFTILKDGNTITDQSANSNNFTLGAGTLTKTEDNPSNVFATLNPLQTNLTTLHNGNCSAGTTSNYQYALSTLAMNSGKYYFEMKVTHACMVIGIQDTIQGNTRLSATDVFWFNGSESYHLDGGSKFTHNSYGDISSDASAYPSYGSGDIVMMAVDLDNNKLAYGKNGTWYNSTNPSSGTTNMVSIDAPSTLTSGFYGIVAGDTCGASDGDFEINFGNGYFGTTAVSSAGTNASGIGVFEYDVPTGYTALSTKGLNE